MSNINLRNLIGKLNSATRSALEGAVGLCSSRTHHNVEIEHFIVKLLDISDSDSERIFKHFGVDKSRLSAEAARSLDKLKTGNVRTPALGQSIVRLLVEAWTIGSLEYNEARIRTGLILLALVVDEELVRVAREMSKELQKIDPYILRSQFTSIVGASAESQEPGSEVLPPPYQADQSGGPRVFICYRRDDTESYADRLHDRLIATVEGVRVFRDTDSLRYGMEFTEKIEETLRNIDVLVAVIGARWLSADEQGKRRLDDARDYVRLEIAVALRERKLVVPCLVEGARMPDVGELPPEIAGLAPRHGFQVSHTQFRPNTEEFIRFLKNFKRSS